jgi:hypothetical protein
MFAPPYEMNILQLVPPLYPYNLTELSKIHFKSDLDYDALRAFIEMGFNKASIDHVPHKASLFGYECICVHNYRLFTFDLTIFSAPFYKGFIVQIRHLHGHYTAYENGIKKLLSILEVKLDEPLIRRVPPPLTYMEHYDYKVFDIEYINKSIMMLDLDEYVDYALDCIGSYISYPKKTYLFIDDNVGVNVIPRLAKMCMDEPDPDSSIPIMSMIIFSEFIKINGSSSNIICDAIMPCIPKCMNNISQHLHRETLGVILAICNRDITFMKYFKRPIDGIECYYNHLRTIIMGEKGTRDICTASYATQILNMI